MPGIADFHPTAFPTGRPAGNSSGSLLEAAWDAWYRFKAALIAAKAKVIDSGDVYNYGFITNNLRGNASVVAALEAYDQAVTNLRAAIDSSGYAGDVEGLLPHIADGGMSLDMPSLDSLPMLINSAPGDLLSLPQEQGNPTFADELASLPMSAKVQQPLTLAQQLKKLRRR